MSTEDKVISADDFASEFAMADETVEVNENDEISGSDFDSEFQEEATVSEEFHDDVTLEMGETDFDANTETEQELVTVNRTGSETEIREVDPTKNAKLQKRLKQKKKSVSVGKVKLSKKGIYILIPVAIIALMFCYKIISTKIGGGGSSSGGENYFSILDTIVQTEVGEFTYIIDVRTKAIEPVVTTEETSMEDVENIEGMTDETIQAEAEVVTKNQFTDSWGSADDVKVFSWQYPSYKLVIEGICTNADPANYEADIKFSLATIGHNDLLTEIIAKDGKYYVDFNSLGVWLRNSKDAYLMSLGADIPEGAKYVVIDANDFKIPSRYAEDYEKDASSTVGLHDTIRRLNALIAYLESNVQDCIGSECYSTSISEGGTAQNLNIGANTGSKITDQVRMMALNSANVFDGYVNMLISNQVISEAQGSTYKELKDNVLYAMTPLQVYFNTKSLDMTNLQAKGTARQYHNNGGENVAEADLIVQFQSDDKFYNVNLSLSRKSGQGTVELDTGNVIDVNQLVSDGESGWTYLLDKFNKVIDYLNPTCIQLSKQLEMNPDRISDSIKQALIDIVNSMTDKTGVYLTLLTADKYIDIYKELIDQKDNLTGTDKVNVLIVEDFLNTVNNITGGIIVEVPVEAEIEEITYPELVYEDSDMKIIANFNQELSNKDVYVVSTTIMNKTDNTVTLNLTNFSLRTLLSSTYSSNNLTTLRDMDNTWDSSLTPQAIELEPSSYADIDLYFVVAGDSGYMDMWYQPIDKEAIKLGVIVQE